MDLHSYSARLKMPIPPAQPLVPSIAVVVPCYRERDHVLEVLAMMPDFVDHIICVDDGCPDSTGSYIEQHCGDPRVSVLYHQQNQGVGGAMVTGYRQALANGADIVVKIDGDGQMDPTLIANLVYPITAGLADYTKGNRFFRLEDVLAMPRDRLIGNAILSLFSKLSTGYWRIFDPNNGYTAVHAAVLSLVPFDKLHRGYFFESDMLFRLNILCAVVVDVPMQAVYGRAVSHIRLGRELTVFMLRHPLNFFKRIFYNYFLRDFHIASLEWILGPSLMLFGMIFGMINWRASIMLGTSATAGTVMLAALPSIIGLQLLLSALNYDMDARPTMPVHRLLRIDRWPGVKTDS